MINISINLGSENLEALIMATREELGDKIAELSGMVSDEAAQVKAAVDDLKDIIVDLESKVAELSLEGDFTAELASLSAVESAIADVYVAPVA